MAVTRRDFAAAARACLADPDAKPIDKAAAAIYVASGGDLEASCTWGEAAELAGVEPFELMQTVLAARERAEAERVYAQVPWWRRWRR